MTPINIRISRRSKAMQRATLSSRIGVFLFSLTIGALALFTLGCSNSDGDNSTSSKPDAAGSANKANTHSKSTSVASNNNPEPKKASPKKVVVSTEPDINEPEFHDLLIEATQDYLLYGMVNSIARQAPTDCRPDDADSPQPFMSESEHESSHGKKLYFLFAKEIGHYVNPEGSPAPVGQVVVKEAWTSSSSNPAARNLVNHASGNRVNPRATVGDQTLEIGQRQNFFIMAKLAKDTPKTDQGWVYGIVDADSRKVLASGKVASCMSCHAEAANDRLFGCKYISFEETVSAQPVSKQPVSKPAPQGSAQKPIEMEAPPVPKKKP